MRRANAPGMLVPMLQPCCAHTHDESAPGTSSAGRGHAPGCRCSGSTDRGNGRRADAAGMLLPQPRRPQAHDEKARGALAAVRSQAPGRRCAWSTDHQQRMHRPPNAMMRTSPVNSPAPRRRPPTDTDRGPTASERRAGARAHARAVCGEGSRQRGVRETTANGSHLQRADAVEPLSRVGVQGRSQSPMHGSRHVRRRLWKSAGRSPPAADCRIWPTSCRCGPSGRIGRRRLRLSMTGRTRLCFRPTNTPASVQRRPRVPARPHGSAH